MKKNLFFFSILFTSFIGQNAWSQKMLRGKIIDETFQQPLVGAVIKLQTSDKSISTNKDGFFQIPIDGQKDMLTIHYLGYEEKILAVNSV